MSNSIPNSPDSSATEPAVSSIVEAADTIFASTPLAKEFAESASIPLTPYRGKHTAKVFSSVPEELASLLTTAGVYDLGWRSFLRCVGDDRVRWLNGMVTNSVTGLEDNAGCYAFVLNAQGRIQGDLNLYRRADSLWLQTDRAQLETLTAFLDHYIIMDDVTLEPQDGWTAIGIAGPHAAEKLAATGLSVSGLSAMHLAETSWRGDSTFVVAAHSPLVPRYEVWVSPDDAVNMWKALLDAGAVPCGADAVEQLRILEGTPAYSIDITSRDLPQETNQMRALHFSKGCYLGQEIVERIHSRGNVHRTLSGFVLKGEAPAAKTPILADGQPVGELTSVASISIPGMASDAAQCIALGSIRREALERKATLTVEGHPVTPASLPFDLHGLTSIVQQSSLKESRS